MASHERSKQYHASAPQAGLNEEDVQYAPEEGLRVPGEVNYERLSLGGFADVVKCVG